MEDVKYPYVAIEGIIGAGKSTLTSLLSESLNAKPVYEEFEENPFLPLFYKDPERYAFQVELSFLAARFHQLSKRVNQPDLFHAFHLADYWFDKCLLFAKNNLSEAEFELYANLFNIIKAQLKRPDLVIYLHLPVDVALERIAKRGRTYEQNIRPEYLQSLSDRYLSHMKALPNTKILLLETQNLDVKHNQEDLLRVQELLFQEHPTGITRITF
jgi:deoxyadenosine/deoxycytidine kinase